jgi:hypothetical protein
MADDPPLPNDGAKAARLERTIAEHAHTSARHLLAKAELAALNGALACASDGLRDVLDRHEADLRESNDLFSNALHVALMALDLNTAAAIMNRLCNVSDWFDVGIQPAPLPSLAGVRWQIGADHRCKIWFDQRHASSDEGSGVCERLACLLPLLASYRISDHFQAGDVFISLADVGVAPGLAFCDNRAKYFLIPDSSFVANLGYAGFRLEAIERSVHWDNRTPMAYWRGGSTGEPADPRGGWRSLPRVTLCRIGQLHSDLIDAGITAIGQQPNREAEEEFHASGLIRQFAPPSDCLKFKYQIDIDGNTNSWPGLFMKLLTGSPVLKVASPRGYRQWYYDRLRPWINFVPVVSDMSDLMEKIDWLRTHDDAARRIGENGQTLAMSMSYESELKAAGRTISAAVRYFADRPETELQFGVNAGHDVRLIGGWAPPSDDGLLMLGHESRLEIPSPVAKESFVLTLDLSPWTDAPAPPGQRLVVAVNGEILREGVLSARQLLCCRVPRLTIEAADQFAITLLHPDGTTLASTCHPLDQRALGVVLHGLTLVPMSIYVRNGGATTDLFPPDQVRPMGEQFRGLLYGPDIWLPPEVQLGRIQTQWGTIIYADIDSGTLRHGSAQVSPHNLMLAENNGSAYLFHIAPRVGRYTVRVAPEHLGPDEKLISDGFPARNQAFRVLWAGADERSVFGLESSGLLLCAETDGSVTLSRNFLGPWERFQLVGPKSINSTTSIETKGYNKNTNKRRFYTSLAASLQDTSMQTGLQTDILVLIPAFNNPTYVGGMVAQLLDRGLSNVVVIDNASTTPEMRQYLDAVAELIKVVQLADNRGPHHCFRHDPSFHSLPALFCITDPDLQLNPNLPSDFLAELEAVTERFQVGKAGFSLDISEPHLMRDQKVIIGEISYSICATNDGDPIYKAEIDTTFALYNKKYFRRDRALDAVRVAGRYTCKHLPWYKDNGLPPAEDESYKASQKFSNYIK